MYITPRFDIEAVVQEEKQETEKAIKAMKINAVTESNNKSDIRYFFIQSILNTAKIGRKNYME